MTSKELVIKSLEFNSYTRIPRQLWTLPGTKEKHPAELENIAKDFPEDIVFSPLENIEQFCSENDKFIIAGKGISPLAHFHSTRPYKQSLADISNDSLVLEKQLNSIREKCLQEIQFWAETEVDAILLKDNLGSQDSLYIPAELFRKHFKPIYKDICKIAHTHNKYVFMQTAGNISDIIEDLIEAGVNALNCQLFCMDIEDLGRRFRGRLTFWGEIDHQYILPIATIREVKEAVFTVYENLYANGGLIAQCQFDQDANPENIYQVYKTWNKII